MGQVSDCNKNGIPDLCDIREGRSLDRDHNGTPDDCEAAPPDDCNRNGVSDKYELALGIGDVNQNGVPDDCETGGLTVRSVPLPTDVPQRYYRARGLEIRAREPNALQLQFQGALEQADRLDGPWMPVN
jgi:hypothetical protein